MILLLKSSSFVIVYALALAGYFGWSLRSGLVRAVLPLLFFVVGFGFASALDKTTVERSLSFVSISILLACLIVGYFGKYFYDVGVEPKIAKKGLVKAARLYFGTFGSWRSSSVC
jgi:hypothetical protein